MTILTTAKAFGAMILLLLALAAACGGSSDNNASKTATAAATTAATQQSNGNAVGGYDVKISGGLSAEWKSGQNDGSGASCSFPSDSGAFVSLYGLINGTQYGMNIPQNTFVAGAYTYGAREGAGATPSAPHV